jgi:hypothetical protein
MRLTLPAITLFVLTALAAPPALGQTGKIYRWVDGDGQVHIGDRIPPEYADQEKARVDEYGVAREIIAGKKTAEEIEAERRAEQERLAAEARRRADQALLVTYSSVEEIEMHRNRRVELFRAQARVTELFLSNQRQQLEIMGREASRYKPYSPDPDAPAIPSRLADEIEETEALITRHEENLREYRNKERSIHERFERDIERFRTLKGLDRAANTAGKADTETTVAAAREGIQSVPE